MSLFARGTAWVGQCGIHAQWHCGGDRWVAQEGREYGGSYGRQRRSPACAQRVGLWSTIVAPTGIAIALEDCPGEEDLNILTDSLSSMWLLKSMQRGNFPLSLHRHPVRQLLVHVVKLIDRRAETGRATRFIKVSCAQRRAT